MNDLPKIILIAVWVVWVVWAIALTVFMIRQEWSI